MIILTYIVRIFLVLGLVVSVPLLYAMYQDLKTWSDK